MLLVLRLTSAADHPDPTGRRALAWLATTDRRIHLDVITAADTVELVVARAGEDPRE